MLHECGADVNQAANDGCTPVYIAAYYGHVDAIKVLHECWADVNQAKINGWSPLHIALRKGHAAVVDFIKEVVKSQVLNEVNRLIEERNKEDLVNLLTCGITHNNVLESDSPIVIANNKIYQRSAIEDWIGRSPTCPLTRTPLEEIMLIDVTNEINRRKRDITNVNDQVLPLKRKN